ncbi:MAG: SprT family zinc-dependent metalloprotease [Pseudomonadota bacterium]
MASSREPLAGALMIEGRPTPVRLRVNRRAKRLIVRVDPAEGAVVVTAPSKRALPEALDFAASRADWIAEQLASAPAPIPFRPGARVPFRGVEHLIVHVHATRTPVRRVQGIAARLVVSGGAAHVPRRLEDWLRREARSLLSERCERHAAVLGRKVRRISVRDPRSRWGSCSSEGALSFSWRLVMAPDFVLDYVAAHECAHLVHMHHGPAFWRAVDRLVGDCEPAKDWLRGEGAKLHRYGAE